MSQSAEFAVFYDEWFARVYNYARHRTGSATRADEIASETFTRALKSWDRFDASKGERQTWLFSIAFRCVADHYRSEKRRGWFGLDGHKERTEDPPDTALEAEQGQQRLLAALAGLSDQAREVVSLRFFGGMTNRAIAQLLGMTESNVAVTLFRSVRLMRKDLSGVEADHG